MHKILLKGRAIEHSYQEGKIKTPVLKGVDIDIEASVMTAIVGKSGSGKSTLLHILGTLDTPDNGLIYFQDTNILTLSAREKARFRNRHLGFVYQFHHLLGDFSALENVMLPLLIDKVRPSLAKARAAYLLERVGLAGVMRHLPSEMSGGERQRVAIARALVYSPDLILADEPTGNLDEHNANIVFNLFQELVRDEGSAVVMVTHDRSLAQKCDHCFEIVNGTIAPATFDDGVTMTRTGVLNNLGARNIAPKHWAAKTKAADSAGAAPAADAAVLDDDGAPVSAASADVARGGAAAVMASNIPDYKEAEAQRAEDADAATGAAAPQAQPSAQPSAPLEVPLPNVTALSGTKGTVKAVIFDPQQH